MAGGTARGRPALYLSFDPLTAVKEANQQILDFIPVTLVRYQVSGGIIADYGDPHLREMHSLGDDLMDQAWWGPQYANRLSPTQEAAEKACRSRLRRADLLVHPGRRAQSGPMALE